MRIEPVKRYKTPRYPSYEYMLAHPELLKRVPVRWRGNKLVMTAVCAFAVMLGTSRNAPAAPNGQSKHVAPIMEHGVGNVSWGGMPMPMYHAICEMTEVEARQIIQDEAIKNGVHFQNDSLIIPNVDVPLTSTDGIFDCDTVLNSKKRDLPLDGYDSTHKIAYEIISQDDFHAWVGASSHSTGGTMNLKQTAEKLRKGLEKKKTDLYIGVFYDPLAPTSGFMEGERSKNIKNSEIELRKQVDDFIKWLKAEGVI